eukprot:2707793-Amphidinium_carterae.1
MVLVALIKLKIKLIKKVINKISDKKHDDLSSGGSGGRMDTRMVDVAVADILNRCQIPAPPG